LIKDLNTHIYLLFKLTTSSALTEIKQPMKNAFML